MRTTERSLYLGGFSRSDNAECVSASPDLCSVSRGGDVVPRDLASVGGASIPQRSFAPPARPSPAKCEDHPSSTHAATRGSYGSPLARGLISIQRSSYFYSRFFTR